MTFATSENPVTALSVSPAGPQLKTVRNKTVQTPAVRIWSKCCTFNVRLFRVEWLSGMANTCFSLEKAPKCRFFEKFVCDTW